MSLTLKISSLVIRTAAKPIGNYIKRQVSRLCSLFQQSIQLMLTLQAREHDTFRRYCITFAQNLHKLDMRLRLGLLQDPAAIDRQIAREAAEVEARRKATNSAPTVLTEEQTRAAANLTSEERKKIEEKVKNEEKAKTYRRIRPLSEAKAIDSGANFISEAFLFCVAGGLIVFETWRSRRKEATRQRGVEERLKDLEQEVEGLEGERDQYRELVEDFREALEKLKEQSGQNRKSMEDLEGKMKLDEEELAQTDRKMAAREAEKAARMTKHGQAEEPAYSMKQEDNSKEPPDQEPPQ